MKVLLDTCAFLWLTTDAPELSEKARSAFQDTDNLIFLAVFQFGKCWLSTN